MIVLDESFFARTSATFGIATPDRHELWRRSLVDEEALLEALMLTPLPSSRSDADLMSERAPEPVASIGSGSPHSMEGGSRPVLNGTVADRVEASLAAIADHSDLNATIAVFSDAARREAHRLDDLLRRGDPVGPLAGTTVVVKDLIDVRGHRTTGGTRALKLPPAKTDADVVAKLRAAGAVVVATANLHALAYGALSTSSDFGVVGNPLIPDAVAGGSSGGCAVAVATGMADIAVGTDTGGSIRIPSAACGIVGIKPTYRRISTDGVYPLAPSLDHVGPMARSVSDCALALEVMSQIPFSASSARREDLHGVTIGLPSTYFSDRLWPEVSEALEAGVRAATELGARIRRVDIPSLALAPAVQGYILGSEALETHRDLLRDHAPLLPEDVRLRLEMGMFRSAANYLRADRIRKLLRAEMAAAMQRVDLLLTPTLPVTVPDRGTLELDIDGMPVSTQFAMTMLTMPFNLTGQPALSLPWASDSRGGSIGLQLAARPMEESLLVGTAGLLEHERDRRRAAGEHPPSSGRAAQ